MASNNFINECKEYANSNRLGKITIGNNEINQDNYLSEFEVNDGCFVNGSIIGSVYVKAFNGNFLELPDTIEIENKQLNVQAGVKFDDDTTEYVNLGNYDITTIKNSQTDIPTSIEAFDRLMNKLDKKYVCNIDFSTSKTIKDVYIDVCNNLGLTPVTTTFLNNDIEVVGNPFTENDTNRAVLQAICKVSCSYVELDESTGKINLKWLSTSAEPDYIFNDGDDFSTLEGGITTFGPVNVVTIANSEVPSENVSMGTGDNEVVINEDYFLYNATLRQKAITNIYNRLKGLTYVDLKLTTYTGKPFIKVGSKIRVIYEGKTYDTYALIHTFKYDGTFTSIIESPALTKQETQIKNDVSLKEVIKNTQLIVNKQEGKINGLVKRTEELEKEVTTVKETSGNNSLYVEDALESRVLEYGIDGKSEQETRSGKNLFNYVDNVVSTNYGLTNTLNDDGSITTTGMPTTNYVSITKTIDITDLLEDGQKYVASQTTASIFVWLEIRAKEISSGTIKSYFGTQNGTTSFWADKSLYTYDARIVSATMANWGETSRTITNFYQIEKGSTKTDFEKYGVSPSPDFPSEIKSVDGIKNLWKLPETKTLNGVTLTNNGDGTITLNGTATANADFYIEDSSSNYINGEKYYISSNINKSDVTVIFANYNGNTYVNTLINSNGTMPFTMNTTNDKVRLIVRALSGKTFNNTKLQIQLEKSPIAHPNVPYGSWLKIRINGSNVLQEINFYNWINNSNSTHEKIDDYIKINMPTSPTSATGIYFDTWSGSKKGNWKEETSYLEGKEVTFSFYAKADSERTIFYLISDNTKRYITLTTEWKRYSVTVTNFTNKQVPVFYCGNTLNTTSFYIKDIMLQKGELIDYEPYKENISLIDLKDNELCSIGDIKDTLIVNPDGTTRIEKKIVEVILDGSESGWAKASYGTNSYQLPITNAIRNNAMVCISSSHFVGVSYDNRTIEKDNIIYVANPATGFQDIYIRNTTFTTLDEFKTWLSENKPIIQYELAEPYTIDLGQVDISLFENINHINLVDDIETDTKVKYLINNVMNGTYATKGELELTNEQFQTTITNEFNSLERQMTSITQTGGSIDLAVQKANKYTDNQNSTLSSRITDTEANYTDLSGRVGTMEGKVSAMNFSFMTKGLQIMEKDQAGNILSNIYSLLDNKGLRIYNIDKLIAIFNQYGSGFKKLIAEESIQIQNLLIQKRTMDTPKANNMDVISFFFNTQETTIEKIEELDK